MKKHKIGKIDYSELNKAPEKHEIYTAEFFANLGYDIFFIKTSNIKGSHSPDFRMAGRVWETKSPITYSDSSFEDNFKKAKKQSDHIIFDLRRLNQKDEAKYLKELSKRSGSNKVRTLLVIGRSGELLTIKGFFDKMKV